MVLLDKIIGSESFIEKIIDEHLGYKKKIRGQACGFAVLNVNSQT